MNYLTEPVQCLSNVLGHAQYSDVFENISYVDRNWDNWRKLTPDEKAKHANSTKESQPTLWAEHSRSPRLDEIHVVGFFPQMWGSTALGFPGIGGAAMTDAYTVVLKCGKQYAVYFGGTYAYCVTEPNEKFFEDLAKRNMERVSNSYEYFKAVSLFEKAVIEECSHVPRSAKKVIDGVLSSKWNIEAKHKEKAVFGVLLDLADKKMVKLIGSVDNLKSCQVRIY
jgi:hypothetical protein